MLLGLGACGSDDDGGAPPIPDGSDDAVAPETDETSGPSQTTVPDRVTIGRDQELRITDARALVTCDGGGEIEVRDGAVDVEVLGSCEEVDVYVSGATVKVESSDDLDIYGNDNQIQAGTVDSLDIDGNGNSVVLYTAADIDVDGDDNTVTWTSGSPDIDDEGSGNSISQD